MKPIISMCAIAAMTCSVSAWADKPEQVPPQDDLIYTGVPFHDCGDFWILNDFNGSVYQRIYFNNDGSINRMFWRVYWRDSVYYNSDDPSYWLPAISEHQLQWLYFKDGVPVLYSPNGPQVHVNVPGYGPVGLWTGTWEYDLTLGEFVFVANPHTASSFNGNNAEDLDAFCAALRP
jgi:hypothetical protein